MILILIEIERLGGEALRSRGIQMRGEQDVRTITITIRRRNTAQEITQVRQDRHICRNQCGLPMRSVRTGMDLGSQSREQPAAPTGLKRFWLTTGYRHAALTALAMSS